MSGWLGLCEHRLTLLCFTLISQVRPPLHGARTRRVPRDRLPQLASVDAGESRLAPSPRLTSLTSTPLAGRPPRLRSRPAAHSPHRSTSRRIPHLPRLRRRDRPLVAQHGPASSRRHHRSLGRTDNEASRRAQLALSVERLGVVVSRRSSLPSGRRPSLAPQHAKGFSSEP